MHFAQFQSTSPIDHVSRMLCQLDRMGFLFDSMSVRTIDNETCEIRVVYDPAGHSAEETFTHRVAQLHGIRFFQHGHIC